MTTGLSLFAGQWQRKYAKQTAEAAADLNALQFETLTNIRTVKLSAGEHTVFERVSRQTRNVFDLQLKASVLASAVGAVNVMVRAVGTGVYTWYAWGLILDHQLTLGGFIAFSAYLGYMVGPVTQVASLFTDFQRSSVALGRMFEYLDATPETDPSHAYQPLPSIDQPIRGPIELHDVAFGYDERRTILHGLSCVFPNNAVSAIVGPSGAGKSTLIRLLCGMDRPASGRISVNGIQLDSITLHDLRRQIAIVWQEVGLFRGTIRDNLTFGCESASCYDVEQAVSVCRLDATISALPLGLDTPVAEWGATLSAGQRQRIAIARALVRDPKILVLDEATSNVDVQTEADILRDVIAHSEHRTLIMITHRMMSAATADFICVLDDGRIAATGAHEELMVHSETYRDMYLAAAGQVDASAAVTLRG